MAVTMITDSDISGVLKNVYEGFRINAFPKLTPLLASVKKGRAGGPERMQWGGNGVYFPVVLTRPVGMTASQIGYFPPSAAAVEKQATLGIKRTYVTREIDKLAVAGTESKEAAFIPLARKIVTEAMDAAQLGQQEVLHGDGRGIKALITTATSTTVSVVQSPYGISGAGQGGLLLDIGMYIAILDATDSFVTVLGRGTISAVSNSGDSCTITHDAIAGTDVGDAIVPCTASDTSFNNYPNGLTNILNRDGSTYDSFEGITAASYARWDATQLTAGTDTDDAAQPTEFDVWKLATLVAGKSGKDAKAKAGEFLLMSTPGIERKIAESFFGQRKWEMGEMTLKGGFKAINLNGIPLVSDYWCPKGTIYLVHLPSLTWVDRQDWVKVQFEDSGAWRFIRGRDAFQVNFGAYWNFGCVQRNSHGLILGYTDTERYSHVA